MEPATWWRRDSVFLGLTLVAFLLSRIVWIVWNPEATTYWEESYRWFAAHELLTQPRMPLLDYQADHYQGGSLFITLLILPFFALFGESLLSLKLAAILVSGATLATLYAVNRGFFGVTAARLAALAYLCGPPLVAFWGVVSMGFHADSSLLSLLQVLVYLGLLTGRWRSTRGWLAFGLACGAGLSFTYITALCAAACVLTWLLLRRPPRPRELLWAALGGLLGLLPWLAYNFSHDFAGMGRLIEVFGSGEATVDSWRSQSLGPKLYDALVEMPIQGLLDPAGAGLPFGLGPIVAAGFLVPTCLALLVGSGRAIRLVLRRARGGASPADPAARELVFFVYLLLFGVVYLVSPFNLEGETHMILYRLFPPLAVLLITPIALNAEVMMHTRAPIRHIAAAVVTVGLASSAVASLAFATRPVGPSAVSLEHGYRVAGRLLHRKYPFLSRALAAVPYADPKLRALVLWGIGWEIAHRFEIGGEIAEVKTHVRTVPAGDRASILDGLRWTCQERIESLSGEAEGSRRQRKALARIYTLQRFVRAETDRLEQSEVEPLTPRPG